MDNKHSKKELHNIRSYNAEHEARDEKGRFTSEEDNRSGRSSYSNEGSCGTGRSYSSESDRRNKNSEKEKSGSHGGSHGHSGK